MTIIKTPRGFGTCWDFGKLKVAVNYGADAVFVGGQAYGLRSRAGNLPWMVFKEGIELLHARKR